MSGLTEKQIIGKTIAAVSTIGQNREAVIAFTDGTWFAISADSGNWDRPELCVESEKELVQFGKAAVQVGLISQESLKAHAESLQRQHEERQEIARRQYLAERLSYLNNRYLLRHHQSSSASEKPARQRQSKAGTLRVLCALPQS